MKLIIFLFLILLISASAFSQQTNPSIVFTKQDYLLKSKKQKKAAWIMLGGGAALFITGVGIPKGDATGVSNPINFASEYENDGIKGAFMAVGALSMLGSIPVFIASGKNKKKTMSMSLKMQRVPHLQNSTQVNQSVSSINLKVSL